MEINRHRPTLGVFFDACVRAGFPSPAEDTEEMRLDLNKFLVRRPESTFFVRVPDESMLDAGIHPGDILIVDRSLGIFPEAIVVTIVDGEFLVMRVQSVDGKFSLAADNGSCRTDHWTRDQSFEVIGVVTGVVRIIVPNHGISG